MVVISVVVCRCRCSSDVVYVEYVVYNDDVEDGDVVVVVVYVVKVDILAANDEKARMNLRNLQVADDT